MGAIAKTVGIRITDGVIFPYTDLTAKQPEMRPWPGPMTAEWLVDTREARTKRLQYLETARVGAPIVTERKAFSIATADKDELIDHVANEFGVTLDSRLPILQLRRQALEMASRQLAEQEAAEAAQHGAEADGVSAPTAADAEPRPTPRGLGNRRAA